MEKVKNIIEMQKLVILFASLYIFSVICEEIKLKDFGPYNDFTVVVSPMLLSMIMIPIVYIFRNIRNVMKSNERKTKNIAIDKELISIKCSNFFNLVLNTIILIGLIIVINGDISFDTYRYVVLIISVLFVLNNIVAIKLSRIIINKIAKIEILSEYN